jgi:hypothetical protein
MDEEQRVELFRAQFLSVTGFNPATAVYSSGYVEMWAEDEVTAGVAGTKKVSKWICLEPDENPPVKFLEPFSTVAEVRVILLVSSNA